VPNCLRLTGGSSFDVPNLPADLPFLAALPSAPLPFDCRVELPYRARLWQKDGCDRLRVHRAFDEDPADSLPTIGGTTVFDADPSFRPVRRREGDVRPVPHLPFERSQGSVPNRLHFGLDPEGLTLELTGTGPSVALNLVPLTLSAEMEPPELPAYGRILLDVMRGNSALSIRADEAEEAWRVLTPVLEGWSRNLAPLKEYDAGSNGPPRPPGGRR
jgi:hypothetical protein